MQPISVLNTSTSLSLIIIPRNFRDTKHMQRIQPCWWLLSDRVKGYHLEMFITNRTTDLYYLNVN